MVAVTQMAVMETGCLTHRILMRHRPAALGRMALRLHLLSIGRAAARRPGGGEVSILNLFASGWRNACGTAAHSRWTLAQDRSWCSSATKAAWRAGRSCCKGACTAAVKSVHTCSDNVRNLAAACRSSTGGTGHRVSSPTTSEPLCTANLRRCNHALPHEGAPQFGTSGSSSGWFSTRTVRGTLAIPSGVRPLPADGHGMPVGASRRGLLAGRSVHSPHHPAAAGLL